ncbi:hypothetical protein [uncultured Desulfobacter sp.]|uniref:hypothetical protein n=1 Tax=uncultured Desulfobacter sp. TaxID=240139 RepID=UPI0029F48CFE|nr:hypothetical protein [uncultured Desulfobacter sp.]
MTILNKNKVQAFRDRLYTNDMPRIMRKGGEGLTPIKKYPEDDNGYPLVPIKRITRFFLEEMEKAEFVLPDEHIEALYTLFKMLIQDMPAVSFDLGASISQEDIQEADNKTTIELLTTNVIITYFDLAKSNLGNQDDSLINPDMQSIIKQSTAGRDYKRLVSNTLKGLIFSLAQDKPWFEYIEDINDADLVCRLAGARLPSMEKTTLDTITNKSRLEITGYNDMFTKLLYTRARMVTSQENKKEYFKTMEKLDTAIYGLSRKIDRFLMLAYRLSEILDIPIRSIIGETFSNLRQNMLWLFFEVWPKALESGDMPHQVAVSALRHRMNVLFSVRHITRFCRKFTQNPAYQSPVNDLFQQMFKGLVKKINMVSIQEGNIVTGLEWVESALFEIRRAIENFDIDASRLLDGKKEVKSAYIDLISKTDFESLDAILNLCDMICEVTHDTDREIMVSIRAVLMENSFLTLKKYSVNKVLPKEAIPEISRRLQAFAVHYRPQREFYRIFFNTYIISKPRPQTPHFSQFLMNNKHFAQAMLMRFSDDKAMKDLLSGAHIQKAKHLLRDLLDKQGAMV